MKQKIVQAFQIANHPDRVPDTPAVFIPTGARTLGILQYRNGPIMVIALVDASAVSVWREVYVAYATLPFDELVGLPVGDLIGETLTETGGKTIPVFIFKKGDWEKGLIH